MDKIDLMFGKIALKNKFLDQDDLQRCAKARKKSPGGPGLGQILFDQGHVNRKQFEAIAAYIQKKTGETVALAESAGGVLVIDDESAPARRSSSRSSARGSGRGSGRTKFSGGGGLPPVQEMLIHAKKIGASDLHLSPGSPPMVRRYGNLVPIEGLAKIVPDQSQARLMEILSPKEQKQVRENFDFDGSVEIKGVGRFRANVLKQRRGYAGVFRVINDSVPTIEELGLPEVVTRFTTYHQGIVLVTGAAGSGKSSTLAALVDLINQNRKDHIITLEDPIEYVFECKKCNVTQRQIERHTQSWENALRASLREDPDVIMVGEMRDLETMRLAVTAAETGHLVLATLHTTNVTRTIDRLLDVFPPKEQAQIRAMVSESLRGVVSQQLVPRKDGTGRVAAVEILFNTPAVANLIRERQTFKLYSILQTGKRLGMKLMDDSLADLVDKGLIAQEEAMQRAQNPKRFGAGDEAGGFGGDEPEEPRKKKRGWRR
jgi:twitching motility protein PilT